METLELEVGRRPDAEWCFLQDVRCRYSVVKLRQGFQLECETIFSGGFHDHNVGCA